MTKRIIICCDGTWNTPDERDGGVPVPTNVVRIYNAVAERDKNGVVQAKYYHPGVGTGGSWWDKAIGGGTGQGLDRNIMSAYRELCDQYQPGDDIFLFGFSRGAYTVRSLGGLVTRCGLLDLSGLTEEESWKRIDRVFDAGYRMKKEDRSTWQASGWKFLNQGDKEIPIRFLGVWDTVGALGIPDDMAFLNLLDELRDHTFHDTLLSRAVQTARHAVALDEMRASFQPTLWTAVADRDVKQVWFPGVHSDVGGGYRETGLSDGALQWMIDESASCGLAFIPQMVAQIKPNELDVLHDSCCGVFSVLPTQPRSAPLIQTGPDVHPSAVNRLGNPPIHQCPYRHVRNLGPKPTTLDIFAAQQWNPTGIWLDHRKTYKFDASGEWLDSSIKCGPDGPGRGKFQIGQLAQMLGTAIGEAEELYKKVTGYKSADFKLTRRHENFPWFSLIGAVANGELDPKGNWTPHESFLIGNGIPQFTPKKPGYLYLYANDAWNCYGNNRGSVELTII